MEFYDRAQEWLLGRPGRALNYPRDLAAIAAAVGIPCGQCPSVVRSFGEGGHVVDWRYLPGEHWAAGITARCE